MCQLQSPELHRTAIKHAIITVSGGPSSVTGGSGGTGRFRELPPARPPCTMVVLTGARTIATSSSWRHPMPPDHEAFCPNFLHPAWKPHGMPTVAIKLHCEVTIIIGFAVKIGIRRARALMEDPGKRSRTIRLPRQRSQASSHQAGIGGARPTSRERLGLGALYALLNHSSTFRSFRVAAPAFALSSRMHNSTISSGFLTFLKLVPLPFAIGFSIGEGCL